MTDNGQRTEGSSCSTTVDIEALECDVSVADKTAVLVNINPSEGKFHLVNISQSISYPARMIPRGTDEDTI